MRSAALLLVAAALLLLVAAALTACTFGPGLVDRGLGPDGIAGTADDTTPAGAHDDGTGDDGAHDGTAEGESGGSAEGEGANGAAEGEGVNGSGEGEGVAGEGEGAANGGEGEGAGAGEGEGAVGGEGEGGAGDSPLGARAVVEVCGQWTASTPFSGTEWSPVGDGSDACDVGTLAVDAQSAALDRLNLYRWLAGLPPEVTDASLIPQEQACADVENGLGHLDHFPTATAPCFTQDGASGAGSSNLAQGTSTVGSVDLFVDDGSVASMGHRRWVLNPSGGETAFGHKGAFTCMYSFSESAAADPDFVTWPPAGPVPVDAAAGRYWFGSSHHGVTASTVVEVNVDGAGFTQTPFDVLDYGYGTLSTNIAFDLPGIQPWDIAHAGRVVTVRITGLDTGTLTYTTTYATCD